MDINSGSNAAFKGGKSRITLPVVLPKNTVEWYYVFSALKDESAVNNTKSSVSLMGQLASLITSAKALNIGINMLIAPPGGDVCNVYLLDVANKSPFEGKIDYRYYPEGTRENISS